ncbi:hypothetical protein CEXT_287641 [Caerostris extrusa]|uniref:Uncharacterized protein n=1 Tax=Caerostris extrusa TaxID=172846 RepID=A0AAV4UIK7_CAEEX|nr:hypothetical protein CEXT_287641 [Caerostris extrusa]
MCGNTYGLKDINSMGIAYHFESFNGSSIRSFNLLCLKSTEIGYTLCPFGWKTSFIDAGPTPFGRAVVKETFPHLGSQSRSSLPTNDPISAGILGMRNRFDKDPCAQLTLITASFTLWSALGDPSPWIPGKGSVKFVFTCD